MNENPTVDELRKELERQADVIEDLRRDTAHMLRDQINKSQMTAMDIGNIAALLERIHSIANQFTALRHHIGEAHELAVAARDLALATVESAKEKP